MVEIAAGYRRGSLSAVLLGCMLSSILAGSLSGVCPEGLGKVAGVGKADPNCNVGNADLRVCKKAFGAIHANLGQILVNSDPIAALEEAGEVLAGKIVLKLPT